LHLNIWFDMLFWLWS